MTGLDGNLPEADAAHRAAMIMPYAIESPMVLLIKSIGQIIAANGVRDQAVNAGLANLLLGAETMLKVQASWGRLDRQLLLNQISTYGLKIGFDLESRTFQGGTPS